MRARLEGVEGERSIRARGSCGASEMKHYVRNALGLSGLGFVAAVVNDSAGNGIQWNDPEFHFRARARAYYEGPRGFCRLVVRGNSVRAERDVVRAGRQVLNMIETLTVRDRA